MPDINVNKLSETLNTKADIDLNNTGVFSTSGGWVNLTSSTPANASGKEVTTADFIKSDIQSNLLNYTTNRILEIPQDIKLELNNGTLTLKAGSKVYVPNGAGTFNAVTITSDITNTTTGPGGEKMFLSVYNNGAQLFAGYIIGGTVTERPSSPIKYALYYNTTTNKVEFYNGSTWTSDCSFPIALYTRGSAGATSIDQVFNGFGYIGSTVFALPGVKCLVGNGRNPDGSCITKIEESTRVSIFTTTLNRQNNKIALYNGSVGARFNLWFDEQANICCDDNGVNTVYQPTAILGTFSTETTSPWNIKEFNPLGVDSLANSNASNFSKAGESYLSSLGMPSNKYINLTLGASSSTYTAPANGWFNLMKMAANQAENIQMITRSTDIISWGTTTNVNVSLLLPVSAGDIVKITYTATGDVALFRFIYAQGDQ